MWWVRWQLGPETQLFIWNRFLVSYIWLDIGCILILEAFLIVGEEITLITKLWWLQLVVSRIHQGFHYKQRNQSELWTKTTDVYFNEVRIEDRVYWNDICGLPQRHCKHNTTMYCWIVLMSHTGQKDELKFEMDCSKLFLISSIYTSMQEVFHKD